MWVYIAIGEKVAWFVRRSSFLKAILEPLFNIALEHAFEDMRIGIAFAEVA
jgi:hypothetical protein